MLDFCMKLTAAREAKGLTKAELAIQVGTDSSNITRWEKGRQYPSMKYLKRLCAALDVSADWLILGEKV